MRARARSATKEPEVGKRVGAGEGEMDGWEKRARARRGKGVRAAGRSCASLPSARSARYAISLVGHVCVTLTFTLVPFGVLR